MLTAQLRLLLRRCLILQLFVRRLCELLWLLRKWLKALLLLLLLLLLQQLLLLGHLQLLAPCLLGVLLLEATIQLLLLCQP
jgi:hypothetical protein